MTDKKYNNRYWQVNSSGAYDLHFTHYYDDNIILSFVQDEEDKDIFWYVSDLLNVEQDCINADSLEDAMSQFVEKVMDYIEEEITYYEEMLEKFNKES